MALAVAWRIGRFTFTAMLPLMIRDGVHRGANRRLARRQQLLGYLAGALTASRIAARRRRVV